MIKSNKRIWISILSVVCMAVVISCFTSFAEDEPSGLNYSVSGGYTGINDGEIETFDELQDITISSSEKIQGIYIIFYDSSCEYTVSGNSDTVTDKRLFLHSYTDTTSLSAKELTVHFTEKKKICDIFVFNTDTLPSWVQRWQDNNKEADILLISTHADDEQLFFAGVLPYYAGERKVAVQVAYFCNHNSELNRNHELLNGLWTVGVTRYPEIGPFPDMWADNFEEAANNLQDSGQNREDALAYQVFLLRKFKPLVVVGHDLQGEYNHGQHILNSTLLTQAISLSGDAEKYKESAEKYGTWNIQKLYLHLYAENPIVMDWDKPLEAFGGATAFQMTQKGFLCHDSQQWTWFRRWIFGDDGNQTTASAIEKYSPCKYGLYFTSVGDDVNKDDFFGKYNYLCGKSQGRGRRKGKGRSNAKTGTKRDEEERKQLCPDGNNNYCLCGNRPSIGLFHAECKEYVKEKIENYVVKTIYCHTI